MSFFTPHLRSSSRSSHLPTELARIHLNICQNLLKEAELLSTAQALEKKCHQGELQHRSILDQYDISFDSPNLSPSRLSFSPCSSSDDSVFLKSPITKMANLPQPVMVPVGGDTRLPQDCIPVIQSIWAKAGYQGQVFTGMQKEIDKELVTADFSRFERQMLCREIQTLRQQNELVRHERDETQKQIKQLLSTEDRMLKTLVAQHAISKLEEDQRSSVAKTNETIRSAMMYARADEQATSSRPLNLTPGPRMPTSHSSSGTWPTPVNPYFPSSYPANFTPSLPSSSISPAPYQNYQPSWTPEDEIMMRQQIHNQSLTSEQSRMGLEDRRSLQDHLNPRMDSDQFQSLPSGSRPTPSVAPSQVNQQQQQTRKKVVWQEPLIGSSSAPGKRYYNNP